jgi:hypothetical protein
MKIRIRAFRAINDKEACIHYLEEHVKVLKDYGITNITTNNDTWINNSAVYTIVAESLDGKEMYGGVRVHCTDGIHPLPVEDAVGRLDEKVYDLIKAYSEHGTGELCGLWNAKVVAGYGISLLLVRAGISVVNQFQLESLFTICADYSMPMVKRVGFIVESSLGNKGEFVYPNENYIARVLRKMNAVTLDTADEYDKSRMLFLRSNPTQTSIETGLKGPIEVEYKLLIP